jgi:NitT/TauT family transport system substrate-binding protein
MNKKKLIIIIVIIFIAGFLGGFNLINNRKANITKDSEREIEKIKIGRMALSYPHAPSILLDEKGFLKKNDLDNYELKFFTSGSKASLALGIKEIDAAFIGAIIPAVVNGLDAKIVAMNSTGGVQIACMTPGINSIEDLKNKKIGHIGLTASPTTIFNMAIKKAGISNNEIDFININRTNIILALTEKKIIDCAVLMEPLTSAAVENGAYVAINEKEIYNNGNYPLTFLAVNNDFIKENHETVEKLIKAQRDSQDFINNNEEETLSVLGEYFKSNGAEISKNKLKSGLLVNVFTQKIDKSTIEEMMAVMKESGDIEKIIPFEDLVDCSFGLCL